MSNNLHKKLIELANGKTLKREAVEVPEWETTVFLRELLSHERDAFELGFQNQSAPLDNIRARLVCLCAVDAEGKRLFDNKDVELLGNQPASIMSKLFNAASKLNGLTDSDVEELKKS
jgi:hypothetical protein